MDSIHIELRGRVQGVGFRWFVVEAAEEMSLAGWMRSAADGSVEIAAAGQRDALKRFETAVKAGPRGARVEEVRRLAAITPDSLPARFEIVR